MAYGVRSHKFLCCLPVRLGVFILALCMFLLSGLLAAILWFGLAADKITLDTRQKIAIGIVAATMTVAAIISLFGFIGTIMRKHSFVSAYSSSLNWLLGVSLVVGIFYIVDLFRLPKQTFINDCINGSTDQNTINTCQHVSEVRFVAMGIIIVSWLLQLYECIIVASYVIQLQEEDSEKFRLRSLQSQSAYKYEQTQGRASAEYLTQPEHGPYPYADAQNSFGRNGPGAV